MSEQDGGGPFISAEIIDRWRALPADEPLVIPLGRLQIDALMLSIRQSIIAQSHASVSIRQIIDGDKEGGLKTWDLYVSTLNNSFDYINEFMRHVMQTARLEDKDG